MLLLSLQHGETPETTYLLTEYALLKVMMREIDEACRYSNIALKLLEHWDGFESLKMRACAIIHFYVSHRKMPYTELADRYWELYQRGIVIGDQEWAFFSLLFYFRLLRHIGEKLSLLQQKDEHFLLVFSQLKQPALGIIAKIWFQVIKNLVGDKPDPTDLGEEFVFESSDEATRIVWIEGVAAQTFLNCLFEKHDYINCTDAYQKSPLMAATVEYPNHIFYEVLLKWQIIKQSDNEVLLQDVRDGMEKIREWAESGGVEFLHRHYLLQAESSAYERRPHEAAEWYDRAIEAARSRRFLCDEALSYELAAKFYLRQKRETMV